MKNISLNIDKALGTVSKEQVYAQEAKAMECIATLHNGNGAGTTFWVGYISPLLSRTQSWPTSRIRRTCFVLNVRWS